MRIAYKILWIEDEQDWLDSKQEVIENYLDSYGFILDLTVRGHGNLDKTLDYNDFDMVVVDYNLDNGRTGDDFIKNFREEILYTDILFYSVDGSGVLRKKMSEQGCDGVYCSSRNDIVDVLKKVIYTTIRKTQDINNIRGLIIAETIDIEIKLKEMAITIHKNTTGKQEKDKLEDIIKSYETYIGKQIGRMKTKNNLIKLLDEDCKHPNHVSEILSRLKEYPDTNKEKIEKLNKIKNEIIELRNIMAHIKEEGGVLVYNKERKEVIDLSKCIEYRKLILEHHNNLEEIELMMNSN